jgi:hypothetical protein
VRKGGDTCCVSSFVTRQDFPTAPGSFVKTRGDEPATHRSGAKSKSQRTSNVTLRPLGIEQWHDALAEHLQLSALVGERP